MQTQKQSAARTQGDTIAHAEPGCMASRRVMECEHGSSSHGSADQPLKLTKRIGSTTFTVSVHFSQTSKETVEDKLLRLMERDLSEMYSSSTSKSPSVQSSVVQSSLVHSSLEKPETMTSTQSEVNKSA